MKKHTLIYLIMLGSLLITGAEALAQDDEPITIRVQKSQTADDDVFGLNNTVEIEGTAKQNVAALLADVIIKGDVMGNVSVLGGSVIIEGGKVHGSVVCIDGNIDIRGSGRIMGKQINLFRDSPDPLSVAPTTKSRVSFYFGQCLFLYLLIVLTFYVFPNQVNEAAFDLSQDQVRPAVIGMATMAAVSLMMLISFLLMVVGIGFLLFLLLFCGLMVASVFGLVVVYYRLGQFIEARTNSAVPEFIGVLAAVMVTGLLVQVPLLGNLTALVLVIFGVGIVMATRFGTNKQWFTRKARYWAA